MYKQWQNYSSFTTEKCGSDKGTSLKADKIENLRGALIEAICTGCRAAWSQLMNTRIGHFVTKTEKR